jgi:hypothetical protein
MLPGSLRQIDPRGEVTFKHFPCLPKAGLYERREDERNTLDHTHAEAESRDAEICCCLFELLETLQGDELIPYSALVEHVAMHHPTFLRGDIIENLNASIIWAARPPPIMAFKTPYGLMCRFHPEFDECHEVNRHEAGNSITK